MESMDNKGGIHYFSIAITFFGELHFEHGREVTLAALPLTINLSWFHLSKGQAVHQGPWASLFSQQFYFESLCIQYHYLKL